MGIRVKIILIFMILLVIILLTVLIVIPNISTSISKSSSIGKEEEDNTVLKERLKELLLLRNEYYSLDAEYQKYSLQLPSENDISIFTNEIYDIANYSNIIIYSIDYGERTISKEEVEMGLAAIEANLVIEGNYYNILNFINTVEKMPRIVKIEDFIIQSTENNYESLRIFLKVKLYYRV